jgi:hypothetical protein
VPMRCAKCSSCVMTSSWKFSWPLRDAINARSESARLALFSAGGGKQKRTAVQAKAAYAGRNRTALA